MNAHFPTIDDTITNSVARNERGNFEICYAIDLHVILRLPAEEQSAMRELHHSLYTHHHLYSMVMAMMRALVTQHLSSRMIKREWFGSFGL